ncbi:MAG: S-layer family protein, partial [Deltaproteobacteria bacterium]|nr:S-layer family protein [Deltaproteobacteria bacterium]
TGTNSAGIYVTEDTDITVTNVEVIVTNFNADATSTVVTDINLSDLVTGNNGNIVLVTTNGSITLIDGIDADGTAVSANGSGNILLDANTTGSIIANADILSGSGHITLTAATGITLTSGVDVTTASTGTISLDAEAGAIVMDGSATATATGSSLRLNAFTDITIGNVTATNVSLVSDSGAITNATGSSKNVTATNLRLQSDDAIGSALNHITTNVATITALSSGTTSAGIYITEDDSITVSGVSVTVTDFNSNATTTGVTDAIQSDLVSGTNGNIVLNTTAGSITLNDGDLNGTAVSAHGTGNILLQAAGAITQNSAIDSGSGHISIATGTSFTQKANISTTADGTIEVFAGSSIAMDDGALTSSVGNIRYAAATTMTIGSLSTSGNISLSGTAITDSGTNEMDITAATLMVRASTSFGASDNHIETTIGTLAANVGSGGLFVTENTGILVDTVSAITVNRIGMSGAIDTTPTDATLSDLTSGGTLVLVAGGNIDTSITSGDITGAGNILLQTTGTGNSITLGGTTASTGGNISLNSAAAIHQNNSISTATTGKTIDLLAASDILMSQNSITSTNNGAIRLESGASITITELTAGSGTIAIIAGTSINDISGDTQTDITANGLILTAGTAIGSSDNHLETAVSNLTTRSTSGGAYITESGSLTITTLIITANRVDSKGDTSLTTAYSQEDLTSATDINLIVSGSINGTGGDTTTDITATTLTLTTGAAIGASDNHLETAVTTISATSGTATFITERDAITVTDLTSGADLVLISGGNLGTSGTITAAGNILLQTSGTSNNITLGGLTTSATGNISLNSAGAIQQNNTISTTGSNKTIDLLAASDILMSQSSLISTNNGAIRLESGNNITIAELNAGSGTIAIIAGTSINDISGDTQTDITANGLILTAGNAIGTGVNHLETNITKLSGTSGSGGTFITQSGPLTIDAITLTTNRVGITAATTGIETASSDLSSSGSIILQTTNGSITTTAATGDITAIGNILLGSGESTETTNADIILNGSVTGSTITLLSTDNILQNTSGDISGSGIYLKADAAITMATGAQTTTSNGTIVYEATTGDITLAELNAGTTTGKIAIIATTGNIKDTLDTTTGITTHDLILKAGNDIGSLDNPIEVQAVNLSHKSGSGKTYIETGAINLNVADISIPTPTIQTDGTIKTDVPPIQSDTSADGDITLTATTGDIVINAWEGASGMTKAHNITLIAKTGSIIINCGTATQGIVATDSIILAAENGSITINGSANSAGMTAGNNILISAGETNEDTAADITLNTFITSTAGNISLHATDNIIQTADGDLSVTLPGTTIDVLADMDITMADGALSATNNQNIKYEAGGAITLGSLNSGSANISLTSGGSILNGSATASNLIASGLRINAGTGAGSADNHLKTTITTLTATTGSGGLYLTESTDIIIGNVTDITINRVDTNGSLTTTTITDLAQNSLASSGNIFLQTTSGSITTATATGNITATGTVQLQTGGSGTNINQNATITAHDITAEAVNNINMSTTATTTTASGGSVYYGAGTNISAATITAASGVITLNVGTTGQITDAGNDATINITANALNIIGHGVANTSAKPDDQTIVAMRSQAIETKVDRVFVASYSAAAAKLDYQIGQNISGILRENDGWSLQLVNQGFMVSTKTFSSSIAAPSFVLTTATAKSVDTWQYTRDLDFQLLEHLSAKSEAVRSQPQSLTRIVPVDLSLFKQTGRVAGIESHTTYLGIAANASADLYNNTTLNGDVLAIGGSGIIPTFGTAAYDQMVVKSTHEPLMFEYWIEEMMF